MTKKVTLLGFTLAAAMLLSYIESAVPPVIPISGVKIGLANIAVIFALYRIGTAEACLISLLRVFLSALLFGNIVALAYGTAGAVLSLTVMALLKKTDKFSVFAISITGGVLHNIGQILCAVIIIGSSAVLYYLPVLMLCGILSGALIGILSGYINNRLKK